MNYSDQYQLVRNLIILITIALVSCTPLATSTNTSTPNAPIKRISFENRTYEREIQTVLLHQPIGVNDFQPLSDVVSIDRQNLILEFDDLVQDNETYNAKIIHCNANWTPSGLSSMDYLQEYNQFPINNYDYSFDTRTSYVHYTFPIPPVKVPGNYMVIVYRESDEKDIILTRRFMVFDKRVVISGNSNFENLIAHTFSSQQINFRVDYSNFELINPMESITSVLRQNARWDNTITFSSPTFAREGQSILEYRTFEKDENFRPGNEFRFFDLRSLNFPGQNVANIDRQAKPPIAHLAYDVPRTGLAFSQYQDNNGRFNIQNLDRGNGQLEGDYVNVNFILKTEKPVNGKVYVAGGFNGWNLDNGNRMRYDDQLSAYRTSILMKQGFYDFQYVVDSDTTSIDVYEGSHFQTENEYEILIYYFSPSLRADLLIGYLTFINNGR
ncbi:MAG: type IX secretion system plug protein domain-containing protein [Bacteroidota bacterium]